jgi:hypothetical protein
VGPYKLEAVQGMQQQLPERYKNYNNIDDQYNITSRTENFVARYYNDSLFTLKSGDTSKINVQDFLTNYPSEFAHVFSQQTLSRIENKFLSA